MQSIVVPYDLHEETVRRLESGRRAEKGREAARRREIEEAMEADSLARIDAWVGRQFEELEDEELAGWAKRAIERHPSLLRGVKVTDPRRRARLGRLVRVMLAELCPGDGSEG